MLINMQLPEAIADFKFLMAEAGRSAAPKVTISESNLPTKMWYVFVWILWLCLLMCASCLCPLNCSST